MIPNNQISTDPWPAPFVGVRQERPVLLLEDKETISVPINELLTETQDWYGHLDGISIILTCDGESDIVAVTDDDITEFSFTFNQNKQPAVAYRAAGISKLRWFDTIANAMVTTSFGSDYLSPRVSLDDKHRLGTSRSDVIFAYVRDSQVRWRVQRERFQQEHNAGPCAPDAVIRRIGMNIGGRFQFEFFEPMAVDSGEL